MSVGVGISVGCSIGVGVSVSVGLSVGVVLSVGVGINVGIGVIVGVRDGVGGSVRKSSKELNGARPTCKTRLVHWCSLLREERSYGLRKKKKAVGETN